MLIIENAKVECVCVSHNGKVSCNTAYRGRLVHSFSRYLWSTSGVLPIALDTGEIIVGKTFASFYLIFILIALSSGKGTRQ